MPPRPVIDGTAFVELRIVRTASAPIFRQIYLGLRAAILGRRLRPGSRLPSSRSLADSLGVARASVIGAFEQLLAEGYVVGRRGAGTYVSDDIPEPASPPRRARRMSHAPVAREIDTNQGPTHTDTRPFNTGRTLVDARTVELWRRLMQRSLRTLGAEHLGYTDPAGFPDLRRAICDYLHAARAVRCEPGQIVVTSGTQQSIDLAIRVLLRPGDAVWMEDPGYPLTFQALQAAGVRVHPIPVDAAGIDVAAGRRRARQARAAFVTPSHQYPTGVVLSMARRSALLAWAHRNRAWIIEDDYASEFRYGGRPLACLQGLDEHARVIYVGTLNKAMFPGLRLGYLVLPEPLVGAFVDCRHLVDRQPPSLHQAAAAEFIANGHLASHIRRMRLRYREQRDTLVHVLQRHAGDALRIDVPDQGMHLTASLAPGLRDAVIQAAALRQGIIARATSSMYRASPPRAGLMLGFSGYPPQLIAPAATRLARLIRQHAGL